MNIGIVEFDTVDPPSISKGKYKLISKLHGWGVCLLLSISFALTIYFKLEIFFFFIGLALILALLINAYTIERKIQQTIKKGKISFDNSGIRIKEDIEWYTSYSDIKFLRYGYDRPRYTSHYSSPPAGAYFLKITTKDNCQKEINVYYKPLEENLHKYKDFADLMNFIQKTDPHFCNNIQYYRN